MTSFRPRTAWHSLTSEQCIEGLAGQPEGLTTADAARRLADGGPNRLELAAGRSTWQILWDQFSNVMLIMLMAVAAVSAGVAFVEQTFPKDAIAIVMIVGLNGLLGYLQVAEQTVEPHDHHDGNRVLWERLLGYLQE